MGTTSEARSAERSPGESLVLSVAMRSIAFVRYPSRTWGTQELSRNGQLFLFPSRGGSRLPALEKRGFLGFPPLPCATSSRLKNSSRINCRVAPGRCFPGAPTDPDVRNSRIRLFGSRLRYVPYRWTIRGGGSGWRSSNRCIACQLTKPFCERQESHLRQMAFASCHSRASDA